MAELELSNDAERVKKQLLSIALKGALMSILRSSFLDDNSI